MKASYITTCSALTLTFSHVFVWNNIRNDMKFWEESTLEENFCENKLFISRAVFVAVLEIVWTGTMWHDPVTKFWYTKKITQFWGLIWGKLCSKWLYSFWRWFSTLSISHVWPWFFSSRKNPQKQAQSWYLFLLNNCDAYSWSTFPWQNPISWT